MRTKLLIKRLLKVDKIIIENIYFEEENEEEILMIKARPPARETHRCPHCGKHCKSYDSYNKLRRWRSLVPYGFKSAKKNTKIREVGLRA